MRQYPDSVMIFAAGLGTRMGALTKDRPKPLLNVAGRALIDYALDIAQGARLRRIVVNTHYLSDQLHLYLSDRPVQFSDEPARLLDTGGGLRNALPLFSNGPVFTLNSDAIWRGPNPLDHLRANWDPDRMDALLLLLPPTQAAAHSGAGDFLLSPDGRLQRGPGMIYPGAQIIAPDLLHDIPQDVFSLNLVWDKMIARRRLFGVVYPGKWCDVGSPEGLEKAQALLAARPDV